MSNVVGLWLMRAGGGEIQRSNGRPRIPIDAEGLHGGDAGSSRQSGERPPLHMGLREGNGELQGGDLNMMR